MARSVKKGNSPCISTMGWAFNMIMGCGDGGDISVVPPWGIGKWEASLGLIGFI